MRKFVKTMQYEPTLFEVPDTGDCRTVPDLSLTVAEIMERWSRNQPLDVIARNGDFLLQGDQEDWNAEDVDTMEDILDQVEYMDRRGANRPQQSAEDVAKRATEDERGTSEDEGASVAESSASEG